MEGNTTSKHQSKMKIFSYVIVHTHACYELRRACVTQRNIKTKCNSKCREKSCNSEFAKAPYVLDCRCSITVA